MAHLSGDEIRRLAREIVRDTPGGIRYTPLVRRIHADHPETPINTIHGSVWDLHRQFANEIAKPSRGVYVWIPATAAATPGEPAPASPTPVAGPREQDFYEPFKGYLKDDLEEATRAVVLGGAGLGEKWGTPDVIGVYKARASDIIKFEAELISAEVKSNPAQPVTAFGQAVAYRLFSHKCYLVMTRAVSENDASRFEALAMLFGIGLVFFDANPENPNFEIRCRAQRFAPDVFYVNELAERLRQHDERKFEELFS